MFQNPAPSVFDCSESRKHLVQRAIVAIVALLAPRAIAAAADEAPLSREIREFEVLVKGTPRGTTTFKIEHYPGRRTQVTTDALVQMNLVVYTYTFEFHGAETWVEDRLERFSNSGADGGKKYAVGGLVRPGQTQAQINAKQVTGPEVALTSNYWRLPVLRGLNEPVQIIDASTGALQKIRINRGGEDRVVIDGVTIPCTEFRFSGDVDVKIWLDRDGLVVRQEGVESGYPTQMKLKRIVRESPPGRPAPIGQPALIGQPAPAGQPAPVGQSLPGRQPAPLGYAPPSGPPAPINQAVPNAQPARLGQR